MPWVNDAADDPGVDLIAAGEYLGATSTPVNLLLSVLVSIIVVLVSLVAFVTIPNDRGS